MDLSRKLFHEVLAVDAHPDERIQGQLTLPEAVHAWSRAPSILGRLNEQQVLEVMQTVLAWFRAKVREQLKNTAADDLVRDPLDLAQRLLPGPVVQTMFKAQTLFGRHGLTKQMVFGLVRSEFLIDRYTKREGRAYFLGRGRAQRLYHSEARGLTTDDLRLPYPALVLVIPRDAEMHLELGEVKDTSALRSPGTLLDCIYAFDAELQGRRHWQMMLATRSDDSDTPVQALSFLDVELPPAVPLEEQLSKVPATAVKNWRALFNLFVQTMLYVTSADARVEHVTTNKEARHLEERIQSMRDRGFPKDNPKLQDLRKRLKSIDPMHRIIVDAATPPLTNDEMGLTRDGKPLSVRIKVAGHWKHQVHGPQRSQRKLIFVEPYWKGPVDGPVIQPPHVIAEPKPN